MADLSALERAEIERFNERMRQGTLSAEDMRRAGESPRARLDMPRLNAAQLRSAASRNLPAAAGMAAGEGRRSLREAALGRFEEEGRAALEEARATRAVNRAARGRSMAGVGEGGTLQPSANTTRSSGVSELADLPPQPYEDTSSEIRDLLERRASEQERRRGRSNARTRRREMTADELNDIAMGVYTRGAGASAEAGPQGDIARRIADASGMKKGGKVKKMAKGGVVKAPSSAARRGDGIAARGKTKGRMV